MFKHKITALIGAGFAALALTACDPTAIEGKPVPTTTTDLVDAGVESGWLTTEVPAPVPAADPLSTNGTWLVPSEIAYGTYKVTSTSSMFGYWALCADLACQPGPGMIQNEIVESTGYIVIAPGAVAVELDDVVLTPAG